MKRSVVALITSVVMATTCIPVHAQDFLGGLLGDGGLGNVLTVNSGPAADTGLVNVGLGGSSVLDLNVGGSSTPIASANVSTSGGGLGVNANVLNDTATVGVNVGGDSGLLNADVGLGGSSLVNVNIGIGGGGNGTPGTPGAPGAPGAPGSNGTNGTVGNNNNGNNGNNGVGNGNGGRNSVVQSAACNGMPVNQVTSLLRSTRFDSSWSRASGVKVQPIAVCSDVKAWLSAQLEGSNLGASLRQAVQSDALISASLGRTSYGADRVLAVKQSGSQLIVFVY